MASAPLPDPYVGLRPFRESDQLFFFGRDRDIRVISSNLQGQSLTVLYGPSGVGKSSVLQAGVLPHLKGSGKLAVVYFNEWQAASFLGDLTARCRSAITGPDAPAENLPLDDILQQSGCRLLLLLDQFEEFLLYHATANAEEFDAILARIVNREDVETKVLIGIREDALSKLDQRFGIRIPNLLGNTLVVEHLGTLEARAAIREPIRVLNERFAGQDPGFQIEDNLVEEVLRQVRAGGLSTDDSNGRGAAAARPDGPIETAFLQLVLTQLWREEVRQGSRTLRLDTLSTIGGAARIVENHVAAVMAQFSSEKERDISAAMFRYLITPSKTKIAQATADLVSYAEAPEEEVRKVLSALSDRPEARILRRLANPERYEIFHDVLAQPILEWRRDYLARKARAAEEDARRAEAERHRRELEQARVLAAAEQLRAEEQARSARRLRWMLAVVLTALLVATFAALYAVRKRDEAVVQRRLADAARSDAIAAQKRAESSEAAAAAAQAEASGQRDQAKQFRTRADNLAKEAESAKQDANNQREQLSVAAEGRDRSYRKALQDAADLGKQLRAEQDKSKGLQTQVDRLQTEQTDERIQLRAEQDKSKGLQTQLDQVRAELEKLKKAGGPNRQPAGQQPIGPAENARAAAPSPERVQLPGSGQASIHLTIVGGDRREIGRAVRPHVLLERNGAREHEGLHGALVDFSGASVGRYRITVQEPRSFTLRTQEIRVSQAGSYSVSLMLLPKDGKCRFLDAEHLEGERPQLWTLLAAGAADPAAAVGRYQQLESKGDLALAMLVNATTALAAVPTPGGDTLLAHYVEIVWDNTLRQDRFFAYADRDMVDQVSRMAAMGAFQPTPVTTHAGATRSFKELRWGEANLHLIFHENDTRTIGGRLCVKVETDMDYSPGVAKTAFGVIGSVVTGKLTDPRLIYWMRWNEHQAAGVVPFDPPYVIEAPVASK